MTKRITKNTNPTHAVLGGQATEASTTGNDCRRYGMSKTDYNRQQLRVSLVVRRIADERGDTETVRHHDWRIARLKNELGLGPEPENEPKLLEELEEERISRVLRGMVAKRSSAPRIAPEQASEVARTLEQRLEAFQALCKRAGISASVLAFPEADGPTHPLSDALWHETADPEDFTVRRVRDLHTTWRRQQQVHEQTSAARREAALQWQGTDSETEDFLEKLDAEEALDRARSRKTEADLFTHAASRIVRAWKSKGAALPGVRLDAQGLLSPRSKAVRWFRSVCPGEDPRAVNRKAEQLATKQRGWERDVEGMKAFR